MSVVLFVLEFIAGALFMLGIGGLALVMPFPVSDLLSFTRRMRQIIGLLSVICIAIGLAVYSGRPEDSVSPSMGAGALTGYLFLLVSPRLFPAFFTNKQQE